MTVHSFVNEFITGSDLADLVGLTKGELINNDTPWLFFNDSQVIKLIPMKPIRHSISHDDLNELDLVYGKEIEINGQRYICRLIKGLNDNYSNKPLDYICGWDIKETHGSEWNRLMYPICAPTGNPEYDIVNDPSSPGLGAWAQYDQENDLGLIWPMKGCFASCQEHRGSLMALRGDLGVSRVRPVTSSGATSFRGWRPCLERID